MQKILVHEPSNNAVRFKIESQHRERVANDRILSARLADIETRNPIDLGDAACSVYIMASKAAVKIGISNHPELRLKQVQTGHHAKLILRKFWWFQSVADASLVESVVHGQLKIRGHHTSGEWFNISVREAIESVSDAIMYLNGSGEIDKGIHEKIETPLANSELLLGRLLNMKWSVSKKGNDYLRLAENTITVFRRKSGWSYMHNDNFSKEQYLTKDQAKCAGLRQVLELMSAIDLN